MSYQVIARKWRPQSFDQLIGQAHVSVTLKNALKKGRVPHALLFTGPRGTGKTSTARLIAKCLKCDTPVDFQACGQCSSCVEFQQGRSIDVIEIDAASNNGVDSVRELRETVGYMPTHGKYKIYIVDEVHMLSTAAFNALLKTLEEPPPHVVFVLATTEVQKIPATILSRCQRFDFRRIPARQVMEHLKYICTEEKIVVDADALWVIARQGDGSMRDSQTLLDQVITFSDGDLTSARVVEILGLTDRSLIMKCLKALALRDSQEMLAVLGDMNRSGYDASLFLSDILENLRHWLLVKKGQGQDSQLLEISDSELVFLKDLSLQASEEEIHLLFDMCLKGVSDIHRSSDPAIVLEMVLLRMADAPRVASIQEWLRSGAAPVPNLTTDSATNSAATRTGRAQATAPASVGSARAPSPTASSAALSSTRAASVAATTSAAPPRSVNPSQRPPLEKWLETVAHLKSSDPLLGAKIEQLTFIGASDQEVFVAVAPKLNFLAGIFKEVEAMKSLQASIQTIWGKGFAIKIRPFNDQGGVSASAVSEAKVKEEEKALMEQLAANPKVKNAMSSFNAPIKSVRDLKKE